MKDSRVVGDYSARRSTGEIIEIDGALFLRETGDMGGEDPRPELESYPDTWPKVSGPVPQGHVRFFK
jgi:hypothetical protein